MPGSLLRLRRARWSLFGALLLASFVAQAFPVPAKFSVSDSGAAKYTVPIQVAPGPGGIQPSLSLEYDSRIGNGLLGVGFSLRGLSSITRCPQTFAQDGQRIPVTFNTTDRFCLDGQRLIMINGTGYGAAGSEYRTERETFSRILANGQTNGAPATFTVYTRSGLILTYGGNAKNSITGLYQNGTLPVQWASSITPPPAAATATWALTSVADHLGNSYTVTYNVPGTGSDFSVARIDYISSTAQTLYNSAVVFNYQSRPDIVPLYQAGALTQWQTLLSSIQIYSGWTSLPGYVTEPTLVRTYNLTYGSVSNNGSSMMSTIQVVGSPAYNSVHSDQTSLQWGPAGINPPNGFSAPVTIPNLVQQTTANTLVADFNGDGISDLAGYAAGSGWNICLSQPAIGIPSQFAACQNWAGPAQPFAQTLIGDFNGDGFADLAATDVLGDGKWQVCPSTGSGFQSCVNWTGPPAIAGNTVAGDFDGDGRTDLAAYTDTTGGTQWTVCLSRFQESGNAQCTNVAAVAAGVGQIVTGDFNGDGLTDIASYVSGSTWNVCLSNPPVQGSVGFTGFTCSNWTNGPASGPTNNVVGDFNGDGLTDFATYSTSGWTVCLSTGVNFACITWTGPNVPSQAPIVGDFNGDGLADMAVFDGAAASANWTVCLSNGSNTFKCGTWTAFGSSVAVQPELTHMKG